MRMTRHLQCLCHPARDFGKRARKRRRSSRPAATSTPVPAPRARRIDYPRAWPAPALVGVANRVPRAAAAITCARGENPARKNRACSA